MSEILLKRNEIGNCRRCDKDPEREVFKGAFNKNCTHMHSKGGWWLRIDHRWDYFTKGSPRMPDVVGDLMCPDCLDKHNNTVNEILGFD